MRGVVDLIDALDARRSSSQKNNVIAWAARKDGGIIYVALDRLVGPKIFCTGGQVEVLEGLVDDIFDDLVLSCRRQEIEAHNASW